MITIALNRKVEIGSIHTFDTLGFELSDANGKPQRNYRFQVIKESTREEFIREHDYYFNIRNTMAGNAKYFYQVSMD